MIVIRDIETNIARLNWIAVSDDGKEGNIYNGKYEIRYSTEEVTGSTETWWNI